MLLHLKGKKKEEKMSIKIIDDNDDDLLYKKWTINITITFKKIIIIIMAIDHETISTDR